MKQRDQAKQTVILTGNKSDNLNSVTNMNSQEIKLYYENRINDIKNDSKKLWNTLNDILGRKQSFPNSWRWMVNFFQSQWKLPITSTTILLRRQIN